MDPNIFKATTGKETEGCRSVCRIAINIVWPNRTRFLAVQAAIRAKMQCDKKSLLAAADASKQRNLREVREEEHRVSRGVAFGRGLSVLSICYKFFFYHIYLVFSPYYI